MNRIHDIYRPVDERKADYSHKEGCTRRWDLNSIQFLGKDGHVTGVGDCANGASLVVRAIASGKTVPLA